MLPAEDCRVEAHQQERTQEQDAALDDAVKAQQGEAAHAEVMRQTRSEGQDAALDDAVKAQLLLPPPIAGRASLGEDAGGSTGSGGSCDRSDGRSVASRDGLTAS